VVHVLVLKSRDLKNSLKRILILKMSSLLDLNNKFVVAGLIAAAAVIGVGIYLYVTRYRSKNSFQAGEDLSGGAGAKPRSPSPSTADAPVFVLFYATWCPHCEHMMGDWKATEKELSGKFHTKAIESADPEAAHHQIPGFPTLRMFPRGLKDSKTFVDYKGPRTAQDMVNFVMVGPPQDQGQQG
jgi:thiol-disulfide isomerase/thioredoxin